MSKTNKIKQDSLVSTEVAVLADKRGYNWPTDRYINIGGIGSLPIYQPTQFMLAAWLREFHKFHVYVYPLYGNEWIWVVWYLEEKSEVDQTRCHSVNSIGNDEPSYDSFEKAFNAGLKFALKQLPNGKMG